MVFEEDAYFGYNSSAVRMFGSGYFYGSDQIFLSIGAQHADGQLAASQDNRLAQVSSMKLSAEAVYAMVSVPCRMTNPSKLS